MEINDIKKNRVGVKSEEDAIFDKTVSLEVTFCKPPARRSCANTGRKGILGRRSCRGNGPRTGACWAWSPNSHEASVARAVTKG